MHYNVIIPIVCCSLYWFGGSIGNTLSPLYNTTITTRPGNRPTTITATTTTTSTTTTILLLEELTCQTVGFPSRRNVREFRESTLFGGGESESCLRNIAGIIGWRFSLQKLYFSSLSLPLWWPQNVLFMRTYNYQQVVMNSKPELHFILRSILGRTQPIRMM